MKRYITDDDIDRIEAADHTITLTPRNTPNGTRWAMACTCGESHDGHGNGIERRYATDLAQTHRHNHIYAEMAVAA